MTKNQPKVAVVTGAASGIGRATVTTLLNQGFQVAAIDVDTAGLKSLSSSLQVDDDYCDTYVTDVASREQCHSTVSQIFEKNGRIAWRQPFWSFLVFSSGNTFSNRKQRFINQCCVLLWTDGAGIYGRLLGY